MTDNKDDKMKSGLSSLKEKVANAIEDITSLQVATFTGNMEFKGADLVQGHKFNTKAILDKIEKQVDMDLKLVGFTYLDIDSDAINFVKENLSTQDQTLIEAHKNMVIASQESRQAMLDMALKLLNIKN